MDHPDLLGATVTVGAIPPALPDPVVDGRYVQATADEALVRLDTLGRYHVRGGRHVVIEPPVVAPARLDSALRGPVAAALLAQRRRYALHASTVRLGDVLVAVTGRSGAGKSTTATTLARRGHHIVTDDVTILDPGPESVTVGSTGRRLHLFPATAALLGLDPGAADAVGPHDEKRAFPLPPMTRTERLGLVVVLIPGGAAPAVTVETLRGALATRELITHTYHRPLAKVHPHDHLRWAAAVAAAVPVLRIVRPASGWTADAVTDVIEARGWDAREPAMIGW